MFSDGTVTAGGWPVAGKIVFDSFSLRYSADSPRVLKNLNFQINPSEKVTWTRDVVLIKLKLKKIRVLGRYSCFR